MVVARAEEKKWLINNGADGVFGSAVAAAHATAGGGGGVIVSSAAVAGIRCTGAAD